MNEEFEWDKAKRQLNLLKHGIDFRDLTGFGWDDALIVLDQRKDYGEARSIAYGRIRGRVMVVVFVQRGAAIRIISLRRANDREVRTYESGIED